METSIEQFLIEKDYIISSKGGIYFSSLLEDVVCAMMEGKNNKEIRKELPEITRDYYARFFQVDRNVYFTEMKKFVFEKRKEKKNKEQETLDDKLIGLGREYMRINNIEAEKPKVLYRCK